MQQEHGERQRPAPREGRRGDRSWQLGERAACGLLRGEIGAVFYHLSLGAAEKAAAERPGGECASFSCPAVFCLLAEVLRGVGNPLCSCTEEQAEEKRLKAGVFGGVAGSLALPSEP